MGIRRYAALFLLLSPITVFADELTEAKQRDIRKLLADTGSAMIAIRYASATSQNIFQTLKGVRPDIPDRVQEEMNRELIQLFTEKMQAPGGLAEKLIPIYARTFTHVEIKELIAFYATPIGKKSITLMPKVINESMAVSQQWGASLGPEIENRVQEVLAKEKVISERKQ